MVKKWVKELRLLLASDFGKLLIPFFGIFLAYILFPLLEPIWYEFAWKIILIPYQAGTVIHSIFELLLYPIVLLIMLQFAIAIPLIVVFVFVLAIISIVVVILFYMIGIVDKDIKRTNFQKRLNDVLKIVGLIIGVYIIMTIAPPMIIEMFGRNFIPMVILIILYIATPLEVYAQFVFQFIFGFAYQVLVFLLMIVMILLPLMLVPPFFNDLIHFIWRRVTRAKLIETKVEYEFYESR
jgi:hypothetical protein